MSKRFPFQRQLDQMDCGPACLKMITDYYGKDYSLEYLREQSYITREGVNVEGMSKAAESIGLNSLVIMSTYEMLKNEVPLPCIAYWKERHFVVIYKVKKEKVYVADPAFGILKYGREEFLKGWIFDRHTEADSSEGVLLVLEDTPEIDKSQNSDRAKRARGVSSFFFTVAKPYRKLLVQLLLGFLVASVIQVILPFLTQSIVDTGISQNNLRFINLVLIGQLVLFSVQAFSGVIRSWLLLHITSRVNMQLLSSFFLKLMKLPVSFFETKNIGDLLQRIQDNSRVENFLSTATINILFSAFNIIVFSSILLYYSFSIFLVFFLLTSFNIIWVLLFAKKRAAVDYKRFDQASGNQSSTMQLLNGMQEIKLNNSEKRRRWEWEVIQVKLFKLSVRSLSISQMQDVGSSFILQLMNILIVFISARSVVSGEFSLGVMLSIQYIIGQVNAPITGFVTFIQAYQDAKLSLQRMWEVYSKQNEDKSDDTIVNEIPKDRSLCIENLSYRYGSSSSSFVLDNISLVFPENKVTAIVGASGGGKTTLIKMILKFYDPTSGIISIGGQNIQRIKTSIWRSKIGAVMQDGYIFSDTIARNITESESDSLIDKNRLEQAVKIANLEEFISELPKSLKTKIGSSGIGLSGGQKQRILIARAVYKNPYILILDEATSSLDAENETKIMRRLNDFYRARTVIVVAHRLSTVKNADNIVVIEKGKIVEMGTHNELVDTKGYYFNLIKNQLELGN